MFDCVQEVKQITVGFEYMSYNFNITYSRAPPAYYSPHLEYNQAPPVYNGAPWHITVPL